MSAQKPRALMNFEVAMQRNLADASARVATTNPTAPAADRPPAVTTIEAKAHPAAPVVPVGARATAEPAIPAKANHLARHCSDGLTVAGGLMQPVLMLMLRTGV